MVWVGHTHTFQVTYVKILRSFMKTNLKTSTCEKQLLLFHITYFVTGSEYIQFI